VGYYIGAYYYPAPGNICVIPNTRFSEQQQLYEINCDSMRTYTLARTIGLPDVRRNSGNNNNNNDDNKFLSVPQKQFTTRVKIILYIIQTHRNHRVPITHWIKRLESLRLVLQKTLILLYLV